MANETLLSRREFVSILAAAAAAYPLSSLAESRAKTPSPENHKEPWLTLSEVQQHLFPAETHSPASIGASDIHALEYLRGVMDAPDFEEDDRKLIKNGVSWLNDLAKQKHSKKFIQLDTDSKEKILRRIESSRAGTRWLSVLLTYLLEALLTDPVYGGNPNGIGWQWLQHQPGFPTPPENKKYFKLGKIRLGKIRSSKIKLSKNRYRTTKA